MAMQEFFQHLANGISLGSLYALIAIGYTMVYGILRLINFAHAELIMVAAYVGFFTMSIFALPWYIALVVAIIVTVLLGVTVERVAYRPLRQSPKVTIMISAIGVSYFLQNLGIVLFTGVPKAVQVPSIFTKIYTIGGVNIVGLTFFIPILTAVLLFTLVFLINKTKVGMAMRAVAKDYDTSSLMGIDVNRIIVLTFAIGSSLAAVGGVMWGFKFITLTPTMGLIPGLKCFVAAVVGGIGNVTGAVIGGFILGLGEILLVAFFPELSGYRDAFAFILLIGILLIKPTGIMGEKIAEKV